MGTSSHPTNTRLGYQQGENLSFEYQRCREAGLPFSTARVVEHLACGNGGIVQHLIETGIRTQELLIKYAKAISSWDDYSEPAMIALSDYLWALREGVQTVTYVNTLIDAVCHVPVPEGYQIITVPDNWQKQDETNSPPEDASWPEVDFYKISFVVDKT